MRTEVHDLPCGCRYEFVVVDGYRQPRATTYCDTHQATVEIVSDYPTLVRLSKETEIPVRELIRGAFYGKE